MIEFDGKEFKGGIGPFVEDILGSMKRRANITLLVRAKNDGFGEPVDGTSGKVYTGCVGLIQQNQSDVMFQLANYPLPAVNLTQGAVVLDSTLQFINVYTPIERTKAVQIESMFGGLSSIVWLFTVITVIICICLLYAHQKLRKQFYQSKRRTRVSLNQSLIYQVITHIARESQLHDSTGLIRKTLFIILSFLSFIIIAYLSSLVNTDLVVVPPALTMRSYKEMLQHGCGVWFLRGSDTHLPFKSAAEGSDAKNLWDWTISKFSLQQVIFDGDKTPAGSILEPMMVGELAFVTDSVWMRPILKELCAMAIDHGRFYSFATFLNINTTRHQPKYPLVSQDEKAVTFLKAFVTNQYLSGPLARFVATFGRIFEAGIPKTIINMVADADLVGSMLPPQPKQKDTHGPIVHCVQNRIFSPETSIDQVKMDNFANLPKFFALILLFNGILFFLELFFGRKQKTSK